MENAIIIDKKMFQLPPEIDFGNREYKFTLSIGFNNEKIIHYATQMKYRLYEGKGKALYLIGVHDDGTPLGLTEEELNISLQNIQEIISSIDAKISNIRIYHGNEGYIATLRIYIDDINVIQQIEPFHEI